MYASNFDDDDDDDDDLLLFFVADSNFDVDFDSDEDFVDDCNDVEMKKLLDYDD